MVARALHDAGRDGVEVDEKRGARRAAAFPSPYVGRDRVGGRRTMIKLKGPAAEDLNGFMDEGTEFLGELRFRDTLRIDGRLKGKIVSDNTLIIGESGQVDADIDCGVVSIRGTVSGRVHGRQRIELLAGSKVQATLISPKLVIEDGAFFQGDCQMGSPPKGAFLPAGGAGS
jgi:cytoskeletal protein CcmA (bactofilin family)